MTSPLWEIRSNSVPKGKTPQYQQRSLEQAHALCFNCESLLCCQVVSAFSCLYLVSAFLSSFFDSKLPLCLYCLLLS